MAHVNRRQWERFAYPAELRLTATGHLLPAKLVDISERGMQIIVPVKLYAGNAIRAELPTPRAALAVTGRVCWVASDRTDGTAQTRAGIAFDPLPGAAEQQLRALSSERPGNSVIVQLPGSDDPVRASAVRTEEGLRLSFALPFLREGSIVTLQPTEAETEAEVARVVRTHVYAGGTGAATRVELLVEPCAETRKRRFVQYDAASMVLPQVVAASDAAPSDGGEALAVPKRRVLRNVGYGVSLAAAVWLVARIAEPGTAEAPASTQTDVQASKPIAASVRAAAVTTAPSVPVRVTEPAAQIRMPEASLAPARVPEPVLATAPRPTDTTPLADTTAAPKVEQPMPRPAAASRSPQVTTYKDTTEIFVPVSGSLAGLSAKLWTDPPAVSVDIPRGQVALPRRRYDLQADGLAGLSVGRPGGVTQLRVYVNSVLSQYEAT
ncbi:MAG TPA: PilZ domain-containing protein, partial [Polyangiales bacterium]|nr:PilZ domain-containing protein [Polyangiales bacterium]